MTNSTMTVTNVSMPMLRSEQTRSLEPLLKFLKLNGLPYSLDNHFPMRPMFDRTIPQRGIWKCARQISKSTTLAADAVLRSATNPFLRTLIVTPRYDQARRLSTLYVKSFIDTSPIRSVLVNKDTTAAVLQRDLSNRSTMFFSYAFLSPDRVRGHAVDRIIYDEVQDLVYDFIPVINECMSASFLGVEHYSGTPKTLDNGIQAIWEQSSQAEWITQCSSCGYHNTASIHYDLLKMIGLKGVVCAKCDRPIDPKFGHWKHFVDERETSFVGYHVPQIILPMHYGIPRKWRALVLKKEGGLNYSQARFHNEVLGESCDIGTKLITLTELKTACTLPYDNSFKDAVSNVRKYSMRVLGIDWGGGGADKMSFTTIAVMGRHPVTKKLECLYGKRLHSAASHIEEVKEILEIVKHLQITYVAHDYGGSGSSRESLLVQAGLPIGMLVPFNYVGSISRDMITFHDSTPECSRRYYSLDKSKSLVMLITCLKVGFVAFPKYECCRNVVDDFLALIEEKRESPSRSDIYLIRRNAQLPDDFVHSVNFASAALWHVNQEYPNIGAELEKKKWRAPVLSPVSQPPPALPAAGSGTALKKP